MFRMSSRTTRRAADAAPIDGRSKRKLGVLLSSAAIAGIVVAGAPQVAKAADPVTINVITINDLHGRLERSSPAAGVAHLSAAFNAIRATNPNTIFASAGDMIGASTFVSFIQQDVPTIDALNAMGLDVSAVGNHELDQGYADLTDRVVPISSFPWLAANLQPINGAPDLPDYSIEERGGIRVGFIGVVTEELPGLVSPAGIANLNILDPITAANAVANQLSDGNEANGEADVVILLAHEGAESADVATATNPSTRFGEIVTGANANIDAIVSAHTHLNYNHVIGGRPVISSGQYGEAFSNMTIQVDPETKAIVSISNAQTTNAFTATTSLTPDPAVATIVTNAVNAAAGPGAVVIGTVTADFNRGNFAAAGDNRGTESTLGNFVADVQLWAANQLGQADIALMNPGGLRTDIVFAPTGEVTYQEAAAVQPFANTLVVLTMTGAQLKQALEQQWQPTGASRPVLRLGMSAGLNYVYDPNATTGNRITRMTFNGTEITPSQTFRVVVNSFLAAGGDNFAAIGQGTNKTDSGKIDLQAMVDYFVANPVASPDLKQRSVGITLSAPDADGYSPGDSITISLSSLDFTTNETKSGSANLSLGGVSLGSVTVDPSKVQNRDEAGRGQLTTTIPLTLAAGVQNLVVTVPSTGTTATLPITLTALNAPAAPSNVAAASEGADIDVTWTDNATSETSYLVQRLRWNGTAWTDATDMPALAANETTFTDVSVPDGVYAYQVRAFGPGGASEWVASNPVTHSTATAPPSAPTGLVATRNGANIDLEWTDTSNDETGFQILRAEYDSGTWINWTFVASVDANTNVFVDENVAPGTYAYVVRAVNGAGESDWAVDTTIAPPAAPTDVERFTDGANTVVTWTDASDDEDFFQILRARYNPATQEFGEWESFTEPVDSTQFFSPAPSGLYALYVRAVNAGGASEWAVVTLDHSTLAGPPAAPTGPTANYDGIGVEFTWTDAADNEAGFEIYRARLDGSTWTDWTLSLADRQSTQFLDSTVVEGETYAYLVRSYNGDGQSDWAITVITPSAPV